MPSRTASWHYLNLETQTERLLQVLLFAQPVITKKLAYVKSFRDRLWRNDLMALSRADFEDMLRWRFLQAGGRLFPFDEAAIDRLFIVSAGLPRAACAIAKVALEEAANTTGVVTAFMIDQLKSQRFTKGE